MASSSGIVPKTGQAGLICQKNSKGSGIVSGGRRCGGGRRRREGRRLSEKGGALARAVATGHGKGNASGRAKKKILRSSGKTSKEESECMLGSSDGQNGRDGRSRLAKLKGRLREWEGRQMRWGGNAVGTRVEPTESRKQNLRRR